MTTRWKQYAMISVLLLLMFALGSCVGANPPTGGDAAAPAVEATKPAAEEAAATTGEPWYNPDDLGESWYNICENTPPQQGGEITSNQAAAALAGGANWFSYAVKDQYLWNQLFELN